jgi:hypothetical protein
MKIVYVFLIWLVFAKFPAHLIPLDLQMIR